MIIIMTTTTKANKTKKYAVQNCTFLSLLKVSCITVGTDWL